jgi:hypothetical protein
MENFSDSIYKPIKLNLVQEEVFIPLSQIFIKEKLVYICTMKRIEEGQTLMHIAISYAQKINMMALIVIILIIKLNKFTTLVVTNQNFVKLIRIRILGVIINNFVLLLIHRLKLKFK